VSTQRAEVSRSEQKGEQSGGLSHQLARAAAEKFVLLPLYTPKIGVVDLVNTNIELVHEAEQNTKDYRIWNSVPCRQRRIQGERYAR
jgi:hypothetical protein